MKKKKKAHKIKGDIGSLHRTVEPHPQIPRLITQALIFCIKILHHKIAASWGWLLCRNQNLHDASEMASYTWILQVIALQESEPWRCIRNGVYTWIFLSSWIFTCPANNNNQPPQSQNLEDSLMMSYPLQTMGNMDKQQNIWVIQFSWKFDRNLDIGAPFATHFTQILRAKSLHKHKITAVTESKLEEFSFTSLL